MRDQELVGQFHRNATEVVRVFITDDERIDFRIWYAERPNEPGSEYPTKRGICLDGELTDKLMRLLEEARDKLEVDGG